MVVRDFGTSNLVIFMTRFVFLFCFIFDSFLFGQENPSYLDVALLKATIQSQIAVQENTRGEALMYRNHLHQAKNAKIKPGVREADGFGVVTDRQYYVPNRKSQEEAIAHYRAKVIEAENQAKLLFNTVLPVIDVKQLSKGQAGFLGTTKIIPHEVNVFQVLNSSSFLGKIDDEILIFKNVSTENLTDGKVIDLPLPVEVLGTETYQTKLGSKTVFAVRMISKEETTKALDYIKNNRLKVKLNLREWKAVDGSLIVEAEFVSQDKAKITVKDSDGKEHQISLSKLSKQDRIWLKDQ